MLSSPQPTQRVPPRRMEKQEKHGSRPRGSPPFISCRRLTASKDLPLNVKARTPYPEQSSPRACTARRHGPPCSAPPAGARQPARLPHSSGTPGTWGPLPSCSLEPVPGDRGWARAGCRQGQHHGRSHRCCAGPFSQPSSEYRCFLSAGSRQRRVKCFHSKLPGSGHGLSKWLLLL